MVAPVSSQELGPGDVLGDYLLESVLGEGAVGIVFRARRHGDGETVALKLLKKDLSRDEVYRRRFEREARAASELHHENVVPILDHGEVNGRHYLVAVYFRGRALSELIEREGPLPVRRLPRLLSDLASGLDALHGSGLVHRDVKSSNIMLAEDGRGAIADFGLAKGHAYTVVTRPGQLMGTVDYLAPELIRGEPATPASDIYALGCVAFECIAGTPPFAGRGLLQVGIAHLEDEPPDPCAGRDDCPVGLAAAVVQALDKDPARRPPSANAYARVVRVAAG